VGGEFAMRERKELFTITDLLVKTTAFHTTRGVSASAMVNFVSSIHYMKVYE
jgi:hypothetical protein